MSALWQGLPTLPPGRSEVSKHNPRQETFGQADGGVWRPAPSACGWSREVAGANNRRVNECWLATRETGLFSVGGDHTTRADILAQGVDSAATERRGSRSPGSPQLDQCPGGVSRST
jgi:hypothetical protein